LRQRSAPSATAQRNAGLASRVASPPLAALESIASIQPEARPSPKIVSTGMNQPSPGTTKAQS
jgi:hypothetical protein